MPIIRNHISDIATVVGKVVTSTETAMSQSGNAILRDRAEKIVRKLSDCRAKLLEASAEGENIGDPALLKDFTNKLPPLAFEIARETKVFLFSSVIHRLFESMSNDCGIGIGADRRWYRQRTEGCR